VRPESFLALVLKSSPNMNLYGFDVFRVSELALSCFLPSVDPRGGSQRVLVDDDSRAVLDVSSTEIGQRRLVSVYLTLPLNRR